MLAEGNARANRVTNRVVFNDPSLGPVCAYEAYLLGGRRRPGCGGLFQRKATNRDVVDARFLWIEDGLANIDFDILPVRVDPLELCPYAGVLAVHFRKPQRIIFGQLGCAGQRRGRSQPVSIQVHRPGVMSPVHGPEPIAAD